MTYQYLSALLPVVPLAVLGGERRSTPSSNDESEPKSSSLSAIVSRRA